MIYDVRHVTTYGYSRQVPFARCIMRLLPRDGSGQSVLKSEVSITPRPAERSDAPCFFGNRMTLATITKPHRELKVEMRARVVVERPAPPHPGLTRNWEEVSALALASDSLEPGSPAHQIYPSRLVPEVDAVVAYARESFGKGRPVLEAASELMARIRRDFTYDPAATEVSTPLAEAFAQRHGVCQDFAHIMIAGLRASACRPPMSAAISAPFRRQDRSGWKVPMPAMPGPCSGAGRKRAGSGSTRPTI